MEKFQFMGFMAMLSATGTLMVNSFASSYYRNSQFNEVDDQPHNIDEEKDGEHAAHVQVHTDAAYGHAHGFLVLNNSDSELLRHQVLENGDGDCGTFSDYWNFFGCFSKSQNYIAALTSTYSCFDIPCMRLGGCITAKFEVKNVAIMVLFFSLTTPTGIAIGIEISKVYNENCTTALIVEGILNAASAGILIYMSLVDLLAADHMSPKL